MFCQAHFAHANHRGVHLAHYACDCIGKEVHVGEEHSQEFFKIESENVLSFSGQIIGHGPKKGGRIFFRTGRYIRKEMISK